MNFVSKAITFIFFVLFVNCQGFKAQNLQTIKGAISDKQSQQTIFGATIQILDSNPLKISKTDAYGNYKISDVAPGRYTLRISYSGYKEATISNIIVINS